MIICCSRVPMVNFKKIPNEQFANPVKNFKIKSYYVIIDTVFTQTQKRFDKSSTPLF